LGQPANPKLDTVLFGGALGSLFSLMQFISSPYIGRLSDNYGRKPVLLLTMAGNILSALLWVNASTFPIFLLARIVGGLSEGNVQLSIAMITDLTDNSTRSKQLSLVGIAFALGFTFGPALGAALENYNGTAVLCLCLLIVETLYIMVFVSETKPAKIKRASRAKPKSIAKADQRSIRNLALASLLYLFFYSGIEFTMTFLTFDRFNFTSMDQGKLLGSIGIASSLIQGGYVRRMAYKLGERNLILQGILACIVSSILFGITGTQYDLCGQQVSLILAGLAFSFASGTVVNCMTSLYSMLGGNETHQGEHMGTFRSFGQLGRTFGPLMFCTLYWSIGSTASYLIGSMGVLFAGALVLFGVDHKIKTK
jgi:predicted MFS family arabinose efflux permease